MPHFFIFIFLKKRKTKPCFYYSGAVFSAIHTGLKEDHQEKKNLSSSLAVLKWEYSAQVIPSYKIGAIFK